MILDALDWLGEKMAKYVIAPVMCRFGVHVWLGGRCDWCHKPQRPNAPRVKP